ncbi:MAG: hypothetical protein QOE26_1091 [Verrucomicrobiota bacterium]|jgi:hypothetical protein
MKLSRHVWVVPVACLVFLLGSPRFAHALVLDWDTVAWTPGSLNNSYDLTGDAVNDITVTITGQNSNIFTNDPATGMLTPALTQSLTGGLTPAQNSLDIAANLHTNSNLTVQLTFGGQYGLATNVSFTIFDIDITTNSDIITNIYGVAADGTHIAATITNLGSAVTPSGSLLTQKLTGNAGSADNSGDGNATISFGGVAITDVFFTFGNNAGAPRYQDIAIGDISFTPVPEMNPAAASAISCLLALGAILVFQRRAKLKARHLPQAGS